MKDNLIDLDSKIAELKAERVALCKSLIMSGAKVVRDGKDNSKLPNRCLTTDGCVGYYHVISRYDEESDRFDEFIPSGQVDEVALFDMITDLRLKIHKLVLTALKDSSGKPKD